MEYIARHATARKIASMEGAKWAHTHTDLPMARYLKASGDWLLNAVPLAHEDRTPELDRELEALFLYAALREVLGKESWEA